MPEKLWTPTQALDRINEKGLRKHHVLVRKPSIETVKKAIWTGAVAAHQQKAKPLPSPPHLPLMWIGDLRHSEGAYGPDFGTAYILEATRICDHGFNVEDMFEEDGRFLSPKDKAGIFPMLIVTETSYTRRWNPDQVEHKEIDPNFMDLQGPDKIQTLCLDMGVAVLRTTAIELPSKINSVMIDLHLGRKHPSLLIP